jgi:hypothetical protein
VSLEFKVNLLLDDIFNGKIKHDAEGCFRKVYFFKYSGRKYALKVDKLSEYDGKAEGRTSMISSYQYSSIHGMGCEATIKRWIKYSKEPVSKLLVPVLLYGNRDVIYWVLMPKIQMVKTMTKYKVNMIRIFENHVQEELINQIPNSISSDHHTGNWGMTNRGKWLLLDY